jgi:hypothetical protein
MEMILEKDECIEGNAILGLQKLQGTEDDLGGPGDAEQRQPTDGCAGDEAWDVVLVDSVAASSHMCRGFDWLPLP